MPVTGALKTLKSEAEACQRCPLYRDATQLVFGTGPAQAHIVMIGEQPGDKEDLAGQPFVGPAGAMLDRALAQAGISRAEMYVTNAVKHFKHEQRGKRRLHQKPNAYEIERCRWWLDREISIIKPSLVVALGVTAASALLRRKVTIGQERGRLFDYGEGAKALITIHPSSLLRIPDDDARHNAYNAFVADLRLIVQPGVRAAPRQTATTYRRAHP